METDIDKIDRIIRHINHVKDDCIVLGERLIKDGESDMGRRLISNGFIHDASKFSGIEFLYLNDETKNKEPEKFELAVQNHVTQNAHHPEFWLGIDNIPRIYVAELVADWHARASEFGTDVREWIKESATKKFEFSTSGKTYKQIKEFVDMLLDRPFK